MYIAGSKIDKKQTNKQTNKQRYGKEFKRQKREQEVKRGSGPQQGCLALQNSLRKRTLPPPRHWGYQNEGPSPDRHYQPSSGKQAIQKPIECRPHSSNSLWLRPSKQPEFLASEGHLITHGTPRSSVRQSLQPRKPRDELYLVLLLYYAARL